MFGYKIVPECIYNHLKLIQRDFNVQLFREKQELQQSYDCACRRQEEANWQQELKRRERRKQNLTESEKLVEEQRKKITELYKEIDVLQGIIKKRKK